MSGTRRFLALACLLATMACAAGASPKAALPTPLPTATTPTPRVVTAEATLPPGGVAGFLRSKVTGVTPILLPAAIPDGWTASVSASDATYSVTYASPDGRQFALATIVPNPPPFVNQSHPAFRGAVRTLYQWASATDPRTQRMLLWEEPRSRWQGGFTKSGEVSYYLVAEAATDAEFWQVAGSLRAV